MRRLSGLMQFDFNRYSPDRVPTVVIERAQAGCLKVPIQGIATVTEGQVLRL